jgi:hypothetical protein
VLLVARGSLAQASVFGESIGLWPDLDFVAVPDYWVNIDTYPDNHFAAVLLVDFLQYVDFPKKLMAEISRLAPVRIATFPLMGKDQAAIEAGHRWRFETPDCWMLPGCKKVHQLQEGKLALAIAK